MKSINIDGLSNYSRGQLRDIVDLLLPLAARRHVVLFDYAVHGQNYYHIVSESCLSTGEDYEQIFPPVIDREMAVKPFLEVAVEVRGIEYDITDTVNKLSGPAGDFYGHDFNWGLLPLEGIVKTGDEIKIIAEPFSLMALPKEIVCVFGS